ncbi:hypothetical protein SipoB123_09985 [Streptomyces ipomoeae]|nr:hypothetical protein SipoB123_09985 [Streptomyces ipomoeae]
MSPEPPNYAERGALRYGQYKSGTSLLADDGGFGQVTDPAHDQPGRDALALLAAGEGGVGGDLGDFGIKDEVAGVGIGHGGVVGDLLPCGFMATVAEQALRPGEARALRVRDVAFPECGGGQLTARHRGVAREIPIQPHYVEFLRAWIDGAGLGENDLLFPGRRGGRLSASAWQRLWEQAQAAVLPQDELYSWRLGSPYPSFASPAWLSG